MRRAHPRRPAAACLPVLLVLIAGLIWVAVAPGFADPPRPAKKDTNPRLKSRNAALTTAVEPASAKPGETVTFKVTARLDPGFHIYKYSKVPMPPGQGPSYTSFDLFDLAGLEVEGDWVASKPPIKHKEEVWPNLPFVEFYEDQVTWSTKLRIPPGTPPGKKVLRAQAGYMVCNDKSCSPNGQWTLPEAALTVLPADAAENPGSAAAKPAAGTPPAGTPPADPPVVAAAVPKAAPSAPLTASENRPDATALAAPPRTSSPSPPSEGSTSAPLAAAPVDTPKATASASAAPRAVSEIAQKAEQGWLPFLIAAAIGGVLALLMPCVWPMIPITVNFFVKQGQGEARRGKTTGLAITYCLSIIGVYTAVGVLFSFFFSASSLQTLANNPWLNLVVAALFVLFGLSLLGLFEIRLPSSLLNASAQGESRGGLIGVVFMALTLTITSFTCTFPVVGGLLVMAAGGDFLYPIVGLATFSAVLALPFFLLALSPGLISRMPRSGDWMNAVKVIGGLVEIGAALKFINTAELAYVTPENAWFNAPVVLTSWIALSVVCGLYLLGVFRTEHDHDQVKVGPGRLVLGTGFLGLAIFLTPALFGRAPQSRVWTRLIVGILPPDSGAFHPGVQLAANGGDPSLREVKATSTDPVQAEREQKAVHGVLWGMSFDQAREQAAAEKKPILIDFTGVNCANCRAMEQGVFILPEVASLLKKFVTVQLYTDYVPIESIGPEQMKKRAELNQDRLIELGEATNPYYVILSPDGQVLNRIGGYNEPNVFVQFLQKALEQLPDPVKVAQTGLTAESAGRNPAPGPR